MGSFQAGMLVEQVNVTTTTGGTTTLVAATSISATLGKQNQIFTGSLGETIVLPDATTMIVGQSFNIFNQSSSALTIEFNGGGAFTDASLKSYTTLSANTSLEITLQDNTSGGTPTNVQGKWAVIASSSGGTGAPGPTVQKFTSGSGTYTTPANVSFIHVQMVGGGGGGAGGDGAGSPTNGGGGNNTTWVGSSTNTAGGGGGGVVTSGGGGGGTNTFNLGTLIASIAGGSGSATTQTNTSNVAASGGAGGDSFFGGGGGGGVGGAGTGLTAAPNSGGGGGAGGSASGNNGSGGGGAGGYLEFLIVSPASTYTYTVGGTASGGTGGTSAGGGGGGAAGYIVVTEYYFNGLGASAGNGGAYTPTVSAVSATTANHGTNSVTGNFPAVGSGTYTTPNNCSYIRVRMCGGGGGGSGSNAGAGTGTSGGSTTFGTSLLTCTGGANSSGTSGSGTINSPAFGVTFQGGYGQGSCVGVTNNYFSGPAGGANPLGGAGNGVEETNGSGGIPNTGAGGAGGGLSSAGAGGASGDGGSAGGYLEAIIVPTTNQTFSYTVGAGGSGGALGTNGYAGGPGGSGFIEVTEYYNNGAVGTATTITGSVPSVQVLGTTTGGNAPTGFIGEFISANPGSSVAVASSGSFEGITSISLTAGDWDVEGMVQFNTGTATGVISFSGVVSLNPSSADSTSQGGYVQDQNTFTSGAFTFFAPTGTRRFSLSSTTIVYLIGAAAFSTAGTANWGTNSYIRARRVR